MSSHPPEVRERQSYCDRCDDTGMVGMNRIGIQPQAVRCSCYLVNPVIRARHQRYKQQADKNGKLSRMGGRRGSS